MKNKLLCLLFAGSYCLTYVPILLSIKKNIPQNLYPIRTLFLPRSQGSNTARRLAGWQHALPSCSPRTDGDLFIVLEYAHSFNNGTIADYLFNGSCLELTGSQLMPNNVQSGYKYCQAYTQTSLRADDLGLPRNFNGSICLKPSIDNIVVDALFHLMLDTWSPGLFLKVFVPITHTRWDLGITKQTSNIPANTATGFAPCYMSEQAVPATTNICYALSGNYTFGNMKQPLRFGTFCPCPQEQTGVADIDVLFGKKIIITPCTHVAPFVMATVPTGNKPNSRCFFEPIVGNGGHWEFGGGLQGHYDLWRSDYAFLSVAWFGHVTYQFKTWQVRFYDLKKHGPFSRYILLKDLNDECDYTGKLFNAIDFATVATRAGGSVRGDASIKLSLYNSCWGFDLGYNIWGRSEEELCLNPHLFPAELGPCKNLLIKGTQGVCQTTVERSHLVQTKNININSGRVPSQLTNALFSHISYTALNHCYEPQAGFGWEVEWAYNKPKACKPPAALNQWRIWFKLGIAF